MNFHTMLTSLQPVVYLTSPCNLRSQYLQSAPGSCEHYFITPTKYSKSNLLALTVSSHHLSTVDSLVTHHSQQSSVTPSNNDNHEHIFNAFLNFQLPHH